MNIEICKLCAINNKHLRAFKELKFQYGKNYSYSSFFTNCNSLILKKQKDWLEVEAKTESGATYHVCRTISLLSHSNPTMDSSFELSYDEVDKVEIGEDCPYYAEHSIYDWNRNESGNL